MSGWNWRDALQFQGRNSSSLCAGWSAIRVRTSASQACGSMSFIFAETMRLYIFAARNPPRSEPANSQDFRPRAMPLSARSATKNLILKSIVILRSKTVYGRSHRTLTTKAKYFTPVLAPACGTEQNRMTVPVAFCRPGHSRRRLIPLDDRAVPFLARPFQESCPFVGTPPASQKPGRRSSSTARVPAMPSPIVPTTFGIALVS